MKSTIQIIPAFRQQGPPGVIRGFGACPGLLLLVSLCLGGSGRGQQPTTTAPVFAGNSQYLQGRTWADYKASAGAGLTLNIAAGISWCEGTMVTYGGGTLSMTNGVTNYVYLDPAATCAPAKITAAFPSGGIPLATVVTSGGAITTIADRRVMLSRLPNLSLGFKLAESYSGADFYAKVHACLADAVTAGIAGCDARGLSGAQVLSDNLDVGTASVAVTLLLGNATITRATGKQLIYHSGSGIIGLPGGQTKIAGNDTVPAIREAHGEGDIIAPTIRDLYLQGTGGAGSYGLSVGDFAGGSIEVKQGIFENLIIYNFTYPLTVGTGNFYGCTCYNHFNTVDALGAGTGSIGSHWLAGANSNDYSGISWGEQGVLVEGSNGNRFVVDVESSSVAKIHLASGGTPTVPSLSNSFTGYLEAGAPILLDADQAYNSFRFHYETLSPNWVGQVIDNSGNTTNIWEDHPNKLVGNYLALSGTMAETNGQLLIYPNIAGAGGVSDNEMVGDFRFGLSWAARGGAALPTGNHAPIKVGGLTALRGIQSGSIVTTAQATPTFTSGNLALHGTGSGTTWTYYIVCRDYNAKQTLASSAATIDGPATLDASNYIIITPPNSDGCSYYDILKTNTSTLLGSVRSNEILHDTGQGTSGYSAPTCNTTGDLTVAGVQQIGSQAIANLPACNFGAAGTTAYVTDALVLTFGATVTSGGSVHTTVLCDGTNWVIH